jgi:hypothetical protein
VCLLIDRTADHQQENKSKDAGKDDHLSLVTQQPLANFVVAPKSYSRKKVDRQERDDKPRNINTRLADAETDFSNGPVFAQRMINRPREQF